MIENINSFRKALFTLFFVMKKTTRLVLCVIFPLTSGGLIYILFRKDSLKMFSWFHKIGLSELISSARVFAPSFVPPDWVIYSLPDALWLFSFTSLILLLWENKLTLNAILWVAATTVIGIFSEIGQALKLVPGTFDSLDLLLLLLASTISFIITFRNRTTKTI